MYRQTSDVNVSRLDKKHLMKISIKAATATILASIAALLCPGLALSQTLPSLESAAAKVQKATLTVRVANPQTESGEAAAEDSRGSDEETQITVCSGVAVDEDLIVSPIYAGSDSEIRITLPGGNQARAKLRVIDEHSGLALLQTANTELTPLKISDSTPAVGSWVLSAAGWGTERPLVSAGIVGGTERTLPGVVYPPLLQCDLRTAITSSGAGVVNSAGELVGVVVATDQKQDDLGWTYAVPVNHVQRLLRVHENQRDEDSVIVLKRRRPVVGMILEGKADGIFVARVDADSPARQAGLQVGDCVVEADGVKIRSVYQAVRPILNRQPGDKIVFKVRRDDDIRDFSVVLGGGVELPAAPFANLQQLVRPKVDIEQVGDGWYASRSAQRTLQEVFAPANAAQPDDEPKPVTSTEKIKLLEKALDRYQRAIVYLQQRLGSEQEHRLKTEKLIKSLEQQIDDLKQQLPR